MLTLGHLLAALTGYEPHGQEAALSSVEIDSRTVQAGSLFVAFKGENADGHAYVADAFAKGALAAIVEHPIDGYAQVEVGAALSEPPPTPFCLLAESSEAALQELARYWRQQFDVRVIGITGSVGKTSTKELVHAVLSQKFSTLKTAANMNNEIGLPLTVLRLNNSIAQAVLEMGMYDRGEISLLCDIAKPQVGVVTNIGPVHMERVGSIEGIVAAKRELIESLPADGLAILNYDDELVMSMQRSSKAPVFTYGLSPGADLWASNIQSMGLDGIRFSLHYQNEAWHVHVPLLGRHSVHTVLRAAAVGLSSGMQWSEIIRGLQGVRDQLRLVTVHGPHDSLIIDDTYNASPDSVIAALNLLNDLDGRRIAVLGDMLELGAAEEESHRLVGRRALVVAHKLVTIGDRGRLIAEEALASGMPAENVTIVADAAKATAVLEKMIQPNDVVLIKGSLGMRMDQIVTDLAINN